jgi:hypothetical protein
MATSEAALGDNDACFHDLAQLTGRHESGMIGIKIDPVIASVHGDPRYARIVAQIGLPPVR